MLHLVQLSDAKIISRPLASVGDVWDYMKNHGLRNNGDYGIVYLEKNSQKYRWMGWNGDYASEWLELPIKKPKLDSDGRCDE